jgi:hypothetical protein
VLGDGSAGPVGVDVTSVGVGTGGRVSGGSVATVPVAEGVGVAVIGGPLSAGLGAALCAAERPGRGRAE